MVFVYPSRGARIADDDRNHAKAGKQLSRVLRQGDGSPIGFVLCLRSRHQAGLQLSTFYLTHGHRTASILRDQMRALFGSGPIFTVSDSMQPIAPRSFPLVMRELGFRHIERRRLEIDPRGLRTARDPPGDVHLERLRRQHVGGVAAIQAYREHIDAAFGPGGDTALWGSRYLRSLFAARPSRLDWDASFVATIEKRVVGAVLVTRRDESAHIQDLEVSPSHRGRGIGSALIDRALSNLASRSVAYVDLTVSLQNPTDAVRLYRQRGFHFSRSDCRAPGLWIHDATRRHLGLKILGE